MAHEEAQDPFDDLLSLEDKFYREGYDLGIADGDRAGLIEGRLFGLKQGFEKYAAMGKLHGRAVIWAGRLLTLKPVVDAEGGHKEEDIRKGVVELSVDTGHDTDGLRPSVSDLPKSTRLENHVRTLYALTEPASLSTENSEDAMQDFEDRLQQAEAKVKVIEKITDEVSPDQAFEDSNLSGNKILPQRATNKKGDGDIEDISVLHARH